MPAMRDTTFVTHVLDLLEPLGPVRARAMMGGHMVFLDDLSIGLIAGEQLFLKVDAETRGAFAKAGGSAFIYERDGKGVEMSYWSPPDDALDDPETMRRWALLAVEAVARSKRPRKPKVAKAMVEYARLETPLGTLVAAASEQHLIGLWFEGQAHFAGVRKDWCEAPSSRVLARCAKQVSEYFAGRRQRFDLPLAPSGTEFQRRVWEEIARVPYGETLSYAELAQRCGRPRATRAAGAATGRNPLSLVVPCHRILAADGGLTGYAGGVERKRRLLALEAGGPTTARPARARSG